MLLLVEFKQVREACEDDWWPTSVVVVANDGQHLTTSISFVCLFSRKPIVDVFVVAVVYMSEKFGTCDSNCRNF